MFTYFKNDALKKLTLGFGNLFNNIYVGKYDSTGTLSEKYRVPHKNKNNFTSYGI